jgi:hypothetical protein
MGVCPDLEGSSRGVLPLRPAERASLPSKQRPGGLLGDNLNTYRWTLLNLDTDNFADCADIVEGSLTSPTFLEAYWDSLSHLTYSQDPKR